jgi:lactoylglutathione lyase
VHGAVGKAICNRLELMALHELAQARGLNPSDIRNPDAESRCFYVYDPDGVSV